MQLNPALAGKPVSASAWLDLFRFVRKDLLIVLKTVNFVIFRLTDASNPVVKDLLLATGLAQINHRIILVLAIHNVNATVIVIVVSPVVVQHLELARELVQPVYLPSKTVLNQVAKALLFVRELVFK